MRWSLALVLVGCTTYTPPGNGVDASDDASGERAGACPSGYMPRSNGQPGHVYKDVTMQSDWPTQAALCFFDGGYLAIPDTDSERQALFASVNTPWVGVDDRSMEGTFVDSKQQLFTSAVASNTVDSDCVAISSPQSLEAAPCDLPLQAICECDL